jgi:23S rRNA pseudouridine2605 synthase
MADDNVEDGTDNRSPDARGDREEVGRRRFDRKAKREGRPDRKGPRRHDARTAPPPESDAGERISKVISRAGVASRRDVERMIEEGRIALNGEIVATPVVLVKPQDRIEVDGKPLPEKERTRLFLYHKPVGLVTTEKDPEGRPTVFDALPAGLPRLVSIGRLDFNTEGLLLLTNDGGLARVLAHPSTGWLRRYRVRAFGEIGQDQLDQLKDGIEIDGMHYGPVEAHIDREQGSNNWLTLGLREGKNREVKRILEHFGLKVNRLIRISFGPFRLGDLPEGEVEEVRPRLLKDQLGPELALEAKVDFGEEKHDRGREREPRRDERRTREPRTGHAEGRPLRQGPGREESAGQERFPSQGDARASRKAEAIAQARRGAAHRHSWRDPESWALRGDRKANAARKGAKSRDAQRQGEDDARPFRDERQHQRGGRISDRKGRSILVERIAPDAAAGAAAARTSPDASEKRATASRAAQPERQHRVRPPRGADDVLRRKTLREQGVTPRPRRPWRESGPTAEAGERRGEISRREDRPRSGRPFRTEGRERGGDQRPRPRHGESDGRRPFESRPQRADARPQRADTRPQRADTRPQRADTRPQRADTRPQRADTRPQRADARPQRMASKPRRERPARFGAGTGDADRTDRPRAGGGRPFRFGGQDGKKRSFRREDGRPGRGREGQESRRQDDGPRAPRSQGFKPRGDRPPKPGFGPGKGPRGRPSGGAGGGGRSGRPPRKPRS